MARTPHTPASRRASVTSIGAALVAAGVSSASAGYSASPGACSQPGVQGLGTAIDYHTTIGSRVIETHNLALRPQVFEGLQNQSKLRVSSTAPGPHVSPLVSYQLSDSIPAHALYDALHPKQQMVVKVVPGNRFNDHRISTHLFNTAADVDALLMTLRRELA